jgi:hypothetical protein
VGEVNCGEVERWRQNYRRTEGSTAVAEKEKDELGGWLGDLRMAVQLVGV